MTTNEKVTVILEKSDFKTKKDLAEELGISRPTLDTRLAGTSKWKRLEENRINILYNKSI